MSRAKRAVDGRHVVSPPAALPAKCSSHAILFGHRVDVLGGSNCSGHLFEEGCCEAFVFFGEAMGPPRFDGFRHGFQAPYELRVRSDPVIPVFRYLSSRGLVPPSCPLALSRGVRLLMLLRCGLPQRNEVGVAGCMRRYPWLLVGPAPLLDVSRGVDIPIRVYALSGHLFRCSLRRPSGFCGTLSQGTLHSNSIKGWYLRGNASRPMLKVSLWLPRRRMLVVDPGQGPQIPFLVLAARMRVQIVREC